ncbi:MAG: glycosyltransferase [Oscillochloridaceae bacterium umkhey_bin13]
MKVRVLMFVYNHERFIAQALEGVLMQETSFDWDVVVLEDCSTDGTRAILESFKQRYPDKLHLVLAPENKCDNAAFMAAFEEAPSEYVAWIDGDDYWTSPHKLQRQVDFLDAHPECSLCFHNVQVVYEYANMESHTSNPADQKVVSTLEDLLEYNLIPGCSPMFRKRLVPKLPAWYQDAVWGDWPLYILFALKGGLGYVNEVMGVYRVHQGGYWSGLSPTRKIETIIAFFKNINACLNYRYNHMIQPRLSKWHLQLALERSHVPYDAPVIVAKVGDNQPVYWGSRLVYSLISATNSTQMTGRPTSGLHAIAQLEQLQAQGNSLLLFPYTAFWWLDYYTDFQHYLVTRHHCIYQDEYCMICHLAQAQEGVV